MTQEDKEPIDNIMYAAACGIKNTKIITEEEKQLLLKDICARLPYGVKFQGEDSNVYTLDAANYFALQVEDMIFKPYLRPMSSMTEEEKNELSCLFGGIPDENHIYKPYTDISYSMFGEVIDWLNAHHFDYRGLIPMGLALEAPEDMYKKEN